MRDYSRARACFVAVSLSAVLLAACGSSGGSSGAGSNPNGSAGPPPPSTAPAASAKGKPCVAVTDPLPSGAPQVPVRVGPPPTQLVIDDLTPGTGPAATASSTVVADYVGVSCSTGKIFDSSYSSGQPATFPLSNVIPGWQQGLPGMKVGGTRLLGIPAELAYGSTPPPGSGIAPDEPLWFVVVLRAVQ
jgi:peptidylprolyl isomerase